MTERNTSRLRASSSHLLPDRAAQLFPGSADLTGARGGRTPLGNAHEPAGTQRLPSSLAVLSAAQGVCHTPGQCLLRWLMELGSTETYKALARARLLCRNPSFVPLTIWSRRSGRPWGSLESWPSISARRAGVQRGDAGVSYEAFGTHFTW